MLLLFGIFPAEACDTIGLDVCEVEMYRMAHVQVSYVCQTQTITKKQQNCFRVDKEYVDYNEPRHKILIP